MTNPAAQRPAMMRGTDYDNGMVLESPADEVRLAHVKRYRPWWHLMIDTLDPESMAVAFFFVLPQDGLPSSEIPMLAQFVSTIDAGIGVMVMGRTEAHAMAVVNAVMALCGGGNA